VAPLLVNFPFLPLLFRQRIPTSHSLCFDVKSTRRRALFCHDVCLREEVLAGFFIFSLSFFNCFAPFLRLFLVAPWSQLVFRSTCSAPAFCKAGSFPPNRFYLFLPSFFFVRVYITTFGRLPPQARFTRLTPNVVGLGRGPTPACASLVPCPRLLSVLQFFYSFLPQLFAMFHWA